MAHSGDFIFPSKIGERFRLIDNSRTKVFCDKVNYVFEINGSSKANGKEIFLYLNSTVFRFLVDLFSRQMVVKLSDVDVNLVERTLIIKPGLLSKHKDKIQEVYSSFRSREQGTIYEEIKMQDRRVLDSLIFTELGLSESDLDDLYYETAKYVKDREERFLSLGSAKSKKRLNYEDAVTLTRERFSEIKKYNDLIKSLIVTVFRIPEGKPAYPKGGIGTENLFGIYNLYFKEGEKLTSLEFANPEQFELFEFFNKTLGLGSATIKLPENANDCKKILELLKNDFVTNANQIKMLLKTNRSSANYMSVYRDLILGK